MTDLPTYVCHKRVQAAEIIAVGGFKTNLDTMAVSRPVQFSDGSERSLPAEMFSRYEPQRGDFLVIYEDGYQSFSPRKAFLEGYTLASEGNVLMERLNDIANLKINERLPDWAYERPGNWSGDAVARVAREAYVTINSLKLQLENLQREKADPDQA